MLHHALLAVEAAPGYGAGWHAHLDLVGEQLDGQARPDWLERYQSLRPDYDERASALLQSYPSSASRSSSIPK